MGRAAMGERQGTHNKNPSPVMFLPGCMATARSIAPATDVREAPSPPAWRFANPRPCSVRVSLTTTAL